MPTEHFIPLRRSDLMRRLAASSDLSPRDRQQLIDLCRLLESRFHFEYHRHLETLKNTYAPFDPDADTLADQAGADDDHSAFCASVIELLERANYRPLSREDLENALDAATDWGVNIDVDFNAFRRLEVYARGDKTTTRSVRKWKFGFRRALTEIPIHARLVILFRLKPGTTDAADGNPDTVYLKMFKDIPKVDVELLLPATRVKMTLVDHGRIFLPTASGVAITIYKVLRGALALAFAGVYGTLAFLGLVAGAIGYGVKSFLGYVRARDKYRLNLTTNLYYQNLDNNAGVLYRLIDEAEEQECREAILAYFLLWRRAGSQGWTAERLDREAERFLRDATGMEIDFEIGDALDKLERLQLVERTPQGTLRATSIDEALVRLDRDWDNFFQFSPNEVTGTAPLKVDDADSAPVTSRAA